jgi:hypothetical protein
MPRSLLRLKCIHGTWVADGSHEIYIHIQSSDVQLFVPLWQGLHPVTDKLVSSVCSQKATVCFMLVLLQIACQPGASEGVQRDGNNWMRDQTVAWMVHILPAVVP